MYDSNKFIIRDLSVEINPCDFVISDDCKSITILELCDHYIEQVLSKKDFKKLLDELNILYQKLEDE